MKLFIVFMLCCLSCFGQVFVVMGDNGNPIMEEIANEYTILRWYDHFNVLVVDAPNTITTKFEKSNVVIEPLRVYKTTKTIWNLDRVDQRKLPLDDSFKTKYKGANVDVFILDTGIDNTHPELANVDFGESMSFVKDEEALVDYFGHGTHVAGIVASSKYGLAPEATIHSVKVLNKSGFGSTVSVLDGLSWVILQHKRPTVVNMSLGGDKSTILNEAIKKLFDAGIIVVAAAGNESQDACKVSPASAPSAITVGGSTIADYPAYFTNFGRCLDLYAPASFILSTYKDHKLASLSGTSMAAPHVAGAVALLYNKYPDKGHKFITTQLISEASSGVLKNLNKTDPNLLLFVGDL